MDTEGLDVVDTADLIEGLMDDDGFVPGDTEFVKVVEEDEDAEVEAPAGEEEEVDTVDESEEDEEESEDVDAEDETDASLFEIEIEGEVYEVNEEELRSGYLRNEQLLKRQQELESTYQTKVEEAEAERQKLLEQLDSLVFEGNIVLQKYRNVDWEYLKESDPAGYKEARLEFIEAQEVAKHREARRAQIVALNQEAQRLKQQAYLQSQHKLAQQLIPELKDEGFVDSLMKYGKTIGYTEDELRSISDAKALFVLNQARLYAEAQIKRKEAKTKVSKDLPPVVKPGAPKTKAQEGGLRQKAARAQLGKTHSLKDAAAVLLDFV